VGTTVSLWHKSAKGSVNKFVLFPGDNFLIQVLVSLAQKSGGLEYPRLDYN